MAVVTRGELAGERKTGYESYTRTVKPGQAQTVRRVVATDPRQTGGGTREQKAHRAFFAQAEAIYDSLDVLQRDFYRRASIVLRNYDPVTGYAAKALTGKRFAIHDIIESLKHKAAHYPKPLPFCICAVYPDGNPAPGFVLEISTENLAVFDYEEENNQGGCFPASAVSPKYEPYLLTLGEAEYGPWTAKQVHDARTLCIYIFTQLCGVTSGVWVCGGTCNVYTCTINFMAYGIEEEEIQARIPLSHKRLSLNDADVYVTVNGTEIWRDWTRYKSRIYPEIYFTAHDGDEVKVYIEKTEGNSTQVSVWNMTVEGINI